MPYLQWIEKKNVKADENMDVKKGRKQMYNQWNVIFISPSCQIDNFLTRGLKGGVKETA